MFYQFTTGSVSKKDVHHTVSGKTIKFESILLGVHSCLIMTLQNWICAYRSDCLQCLNSRLLLQGNVLFLHCLHLLLQWKLSARPLKYLKYSAPWAHDGSCSLHLQPSSLSSSCKAQTNPTGDFEQRWECALRRRLSVLYCRSVKRGR